ncbi:hypothetical protein VO56_01500 [Mycoplasmopsis gallinacea]|uniref:Uncharacterized protein n=1 Tax=Mycoplasmopsis gallinacea TaxID=29556 RepID=A0A0D5ZJL2_9BACT|nr:hypothetical protein VO56_01500 [Mycoplasmopsis gallinacea]
MDKNLGFYDIRYNEQNQKEVFFNNIDGDYRRHQLYEIKYSDTQNVMGTTIYSPFVGGEEILKIKDKYYVNATRTLAVTDSNLPSGSSGTVYSFDGENLFIKISSLENQNMGLWLPTSKLFFDPIENYIYEDIYGKKSEYIADRKFDFSLLVHTWYDPKMNNFLAHFKDKYNDISRIGVNYIYVHDGKFFEETESPIRKFYQ